MNITNDKRPMKEVLQEEIDRCNDFVEERLANPRAWGKTIAMIIARDIEVAEKAIEDNNETAMFHSLRALRLNNL